MKSPEPPAKGRAGSNIKRATPPKGKASDVIGPKTSSSKLPSKPSATPTASPAQSDLIPAQPWSHEELAEPSEQELEQQISRLLHEALQPPGRNLTTDLVIRRHALDDQTITCSLARAEFLRHMTRLHLDRQHLVDLPMEVMQAMPCLTHVYLQHNRITSMAALAALPKLMFAALGHNQINQIDGVSQLTELMMLDVSHNELTNIEAHVLPASIRFLKVADNPCTRDAAGCAHVRADVLQHLPLIRDLDGPLADDGSSEAEDDETDASETCSTPAGDEHVGAGQLGVQVQQEDSQQLLTQGSGVLSPSGAASRAWHRGAADQGIGCHLGGSTDAEDAVTAQYTVTASNNTLQQQQTPSHSMDDAMGDAFITSALDMLEALERGCAKASMSILNASVQLNASRAATTSNLIQARTSTCSNPASRPVTPATHKPSDCMAALPATQPALQSQPLRQPPVQAMPQVGSATAGLSPRASVTSTAQRPSLSRPLSGKLSLDPLDAAPSLRRLDSKGSITPGLGQVLSHAGPSDGKPHLGTASMMQQGGVLGPRGSLRTSDSVLGRLSTDLGLAGSGRGDDQGSLLGSGALEQQITADLAMLRAQLERLVEPLKWAAECVAAAAEGLDTSGTGAQATASSAVQTAVQGVQPGSASKSKAVSSAGGSKRPTSSGSRPSSSQSKSAVRVRPASGASGSSALQVEAAAKSGTGVVPGSSSQGVQQQHSDSSSMQATTDQPSLHSHLDRMLMSAAARVSEQRAWDSQVSEEIRSLRKSSSIASEVKCNLNLKSAMALGSAAVAAVRHAVEAGAAQGPLATGVVRSAIEQHVTAEAVRGPDAGSDDVSALRASLARLGQLSTAVMVEHGADLDALQAMSSPTAQGPPAGEANTGSTSSQGSALAGNKYYAKAIQARAAALGGLSHAVIDEEGEEEEEAAVVVGGRMLDQDDDDGDDEQDDQDEVYSDDGGGAATQSHAVGGVQPRSEGKTSAYARIVAKVSQKQLQ